MFFIKPFSALCNRLRVAAFFLQAIFVYLVILAFLKCGLTVFLAVSSFFPCFVVCVLFTVRGTMQRQYIRID